ncbi:MAG: 50S ribosomal protein L29 [Parcubacteria group bacterium LiPW_72]|nr:MAG: 50S ribosomal protein L29 [Parcubacteria group bacterium LiPW_72]
MGMKEFKQKSISELQYELASERDKMREFNFKLAQGEVKNVRALRKVKKEIARILTLLNIRKRINGSAQLTINP